jgi:hypothetical protein
MVGLAGAIGSCSALIFTKVAVHHLDTGPRLERISPEELVDSVVSIRSPVSS